MRKEELRSCFCAALEPHRKEPRPRLVCCELGFPSKARNADSSAAILKTKQWGATIVPGFTKTQREMGHVSDGMDRGSANRFER